MIQEELQKSIEKLTVDNGLEQSSTEAEIIQRAKLDFIPKISVIIPVYNVENYLRECLDSVLNQILKEIEIICIDDGSTDNSLNILKEYAKKDSRITVLHQNNINAGVARNAGISICCGKYISFIDSDDYIDRNMYMKLYTKSEYNNLDICICKFSQFDNITKNEIMESGINKYYVNKYNKDSNGNIIPSNGSNIFQITNPAPWNKIYNGSLIKNSHILFQNIHSSNDVAFTYSAISIAKKIGFCDEVLYYYRSNTSSSLTDKKDSNIFCFYDSLIELKNRLIKYNNYEKYKYSYLNLSIGVSFYNYNKVNNKNKDVLRLAFKKNIFNNFGLNESTYSKIYDFYKQRVHSIMTLSDVYKVSIIIPIFNASKYLNECLDSIINQTLHDIEIICVNDGSTDNSLDIIKEYALKDIRIKYIDKPNAGYGQTMNCGMALASGEYIGIVEPDDFVKNNMFYKLYNYAKKFDLDVIKSDYCQFKGEKNKYTYTNKKLINDYSYYNCVMSPYKYQKLLLVMTINPAGIYKKSFLDHYNIKHNETPGASYQDNGFWIQTMYLAKKILFIDDIFYCYRQDNPNQSIKKRNNIYTIPKEYEFIDKLFEKYDELKKFKSIYIYRKYIAFMWHMKDRLSYQNWEEYLNYIAKNLKKHEKNKELDLSIFSKKDASDLSLIMTNIDEYLKKYKQISISIIIPVYNTEKYLKKCLDSVISQTFSDIEIICVNDGSTDNSPAILQEYAQKDKRIIVINQKNLKQGAARNNALKIARGKYVQFVDSDDYLRQDACALLVKKAEELDLDMLSFAGNNFRNDTGEIEDNPYYNFRYLPANWNKQVFTYKDCADFLPSMAVSTALTLYKRDFIIKNNIHFSENLFFEDNIFFIRAITSAKRVSIEKEVLYFRRIHNKSTTNNWMYIFNNYMTVSDIVLKYLNSIHIEKNIYDKYKSYYMNICTNLYYSYPLKWRKKYRNQFNSLMMKYGYAFRIKTKAYSIGVFDFYRHDKTNSGEKVYLLGLEVFKKKLFNNKKRIYLFGLPVYSVKKEGFKTIRRILFIRYSKTDHIKAQAAETRQVLLDAFTHENNRIRTELIARLNNFKQETAEYKAEMDNRIADLQSKGESSRHNAYAARKNAAEAMWGILFNNVITDSPWLKNRSFSAGRWAMGYPALYVLYRVLNESHPVNILELGLGQSTRMISQYADSFDEVSHTVVEHDREWITFFKRSFELSPRSNLVLLNRETTAYKEAENIRTFAGFADIFSDKKFDFICIDAPFGGDMKQYSRIDVLKILPKCLNHEFIIMLDDTNRIGESRTLEEMLSVLTTSGIPFFVGHYEGDKKTSVICSAGMKFFASL